MSRAWRFRIAVLLLATAGMVTATVYFSRHEQTDDRSDESRAETRPEADGVITEEEAIEIAKNEIVRLGGSLDRVETPSVMAIEDRDEWMVFFLITPSQEPSDITIYVNRKTGKAELAPSR
jgi:hypothetical protein